MRKILSILLILALVFSFALVGCSNDTDQQPDPQAEERDIILATTTSTRDSGLLDYLLPIFKEESNINVKVVAVGTGQALQMGRDGEADILLVHAKATEEIFMQEGHGVVRHDVMYNDFVVVGPEDDPAKLKEKAPQDIIAGFKLIAENEAPFVSRGDESGTHIMEKNLWAEAEIEPEGEWYISAGKGMADVLKMADEKLGYTLTDRATYLNLMDVVELDILLEKDEKLFNQYGIIPVNPEKNENIKAEDAIIFMEWMLSDETQSLIGEFGVDKFGMPLFTPNAN
ncbi:MAG: substrate-binding domain-containing protein [Peptostreptococcales bacterium]|jgi:tungstate transport system substrate-binding protein